METNIFCPHLFKDVTFNYEKEVRFVLAREVLRQKRGAMSRMHPATFINDFELSPRLQEEKQSAADGLIKDLIQNARSAKEHGQPLVQLWLDLYTPHDGTPFTEADSLKRSFPI